LIWEEIVALYGLTLDSPPRNFQPRYNVCPTDPIDTIVPSHSMKIGINTTRGGHPPPGSGLRRAAKACSAGQPICCGLAMMVVSCRAASTDKEQLFNDCLLDQFLFDTG